MSTRSQWKMLHLLYTLPPSLQQGLTYSELNSVGLDCGPDTFQPLINAEAIQLSGDRYVLSKAAMGILGNCIVANRRWASKDIWVDFPKAFVIMPFSESWSPTVYDLFIEPAVLGAQLECVRGDTSLRIGDLAQNIWNDILQAGIIIADVSAVNANVFYEVGLAHALGKEVFLLKQKDKNIPADFGGSHYYEYDLNNLQAAKDMLQTELSNFSKENNFQNVKSLRKG